MTPNPIKVDDLVEFRGEPGHQANGDRGIVVSGPAPGRGQHQGTTTVDVWWDGDGPSQCDVALLVPAGATV